MSGEFQSLSHHAPELPKKDLRYWLSILTSFTALIGFLGSLLYGVIVLGRYLEQMDSLTREAQEEKVKIRKAITEVEKTAKAAQAERESSPNRFIETSTTPTFRTTPTLDLHPKKAKAKKQP